MVCSEMARPVRHVSRAAKSLSFSSPAREAIFYFFNAKSGMGSYENDTVSIDSMNWLYLLT